MAGLEAAAGFALDAYPPSASPASAGASSFGRPAAPSEIALSFASYFARVRRLMRASLIFCFSFWSLIRSSLHSLWILTNASRCSRFDEPSGAAPPDFASSSTRSNALSFSSISPSRALNCSSSRPSTSSSGSGSGSFGLGGGRLAGAFGAFDFSMAALPYPPSPPPPPLAAAGGGKAGAPPFGSDSRLSKRSSVPFLARPRSAGARDLNARSSASAGGRLSEAAGTSGRTFSEKCRRAVNPGCSTPRIDVYCCAAPWTVGATRASKAVCGRCRSFATSSMQSVDRIADASACFALPEIALSGMRVASACSQKISRKSCRTSESWKRSTRTRKGIEATRPWSASLRQTLPKNCIMRSAWRRPSRWCFARVRKKSKSQLL